MFESAFQVKSHDFIYDQKNKSLRETQTKNKLRYLKCNQTIAKTA